MKSNVIISSTDRELFGVTIRQETKTGFLNLSDLQDVYDSVKFNKGWAKEKTVQSILSTKDNHERIFYLLEKQGIINCEISQFIEMMKNPAKNLKKLKAYKTTGARHTKTTWCNPYLWVLIAMEMNPELYANVVMWLGDKLILNRIEAGNLYKGFSEAISKFNPDYRETAKALNYIVFGRHETGIRNSATQLELSNLVDVQKKLAFAVNMGYIKNKKVLIEEMRKMYHIQRQLEANNG